MSNHAVPFGLMKSHWGFERVECHPFDNGDFFTFFILREDACDLASTFDHLPNPITEVR